MGAPYQAQFLVGGEEAALLPSDSFFFHAPHMHTPLWILGYTSLGKHRSKGFAKAPRTDDSLPGCYGLACKLVGNYHGRAFYGVSIYSRTYHHSCSVT